MPKCSKQQAVSRLNNAGRQLESTRLDAWRNKDNRNLGWDGYVRGQWPELVPVIWPGGNP